MYFEKRTSAIFPKVLEYPIPSNWHLFIRSVGQSVLSVLAKYSLPIQLAEVDLDINYVKCNIDRNQRSIF